MSDEYDSVPIAGIILFIFGIITFVFTLVGFLSEGLLKLLNPTYYALIAFKP